MRRLTVAASVAVALALLLPAAPAAAQGYRWEGGHDASGWAAPSESMYFAEGTTRNGFEEYMIIRNPGASTAKVTLAYLLPSEPPRTQSLDIAPWASASICVNDFVGRGKDVSVQVFSLPGVIAERQVYFNYKGVWTGGHDTCGAPATSDRWYFAEGTTRPGFQEWLCLQNPGVADVTAKLTYMLGTGENKTEQLVVPASSRRTVDVNSSVGPGQDVSVTVESSGPLVAERPMYFDYKGAWRGGHTATGATALAGQWDFAEGTTRDGFEEWLSLFNPGEATRARVEYMFTGEKPVVKEYALAARSRTTVDVNREAGAGKDVSIEVTCPNDILCERPMYFRYHSALEGGHDIMGASQASNTVFFPITGSGDGFESWACVMNMGGETNRVLVQVYGEGGGYDEEGVEMPAHSRATFDLNRLSSGMTHPWLKITGSRDLIAERPVYFSYKPKVAPLPFTFAVWNGVELKCPIPYPELVGTVFHEAGADSSNGPFSNPQVMQPYGICLRDDNPGARFPGLSLSLGSDPAYYIEDTRARGTFSTTACDVGAKAGTTACSPVNGTVVEAAPYLLYGRYPDYRARIAIDGRPGYKVVMLHMSQLLVSPGQRVEAGVTPVGIVRDLVPYFNSGPSPYTREEGNHVHVQIGYQP